MIQSRNRKSILDFFVTKGVYHMQYEMIILELLARIKRLEDEVEKLKQNFPTALTSNEVESDETDMQIVSASAGAYKKMTEEMIEICYKCGIKAAKGESVPELAEDIAETTGMNKNSAIMYLYAVQGMLEGTIYKRAISAKATKKYYDLIFNEYGSKGLKKALQATKLHIEYRKECGHTVDSIEELYTTYESRL